MDLTSWYVNTINISQPDGTNNLDGSRNYGAVIPVKCRLESKIGLVRNADGNERQYDTVIATSTEITLFDRLWLPGQNPVSDEPRRPIKIVNATDKTGTRYVLYEVYL